MELDTNAWDSLNAKQFAFIMNIRRGYSFSVNTRFHLDSFAKLIHFLISEFNFYPKPLLSFQPFLFPIKFPRQWLIWLVPFHSPVPPKTRINRLRLKFWKYNFSFFHLVESHLLALLLGVIANKFSTWWLKHRWCELGGKIELEKWHLHRPRQSVAQWWSKSELIVRKDVYIGSFI